MKNVRLSDLILIDVETVPTAPGYDNLPPEWQELWSEKAAYLIQSGSTPQESFDRRAGVMAEFSKIICISLGYFNGDNQLKLKSIAGHDENALLKEFLELLNAYEKKNKQWYFAGHNIKEFDIPFICRRLLINNLSIPPFLDFQQMKPWETNLLDTFQYWRFGDYKHFTSLKLLAACLGVPSPKDDIDGSMVAKVYWQEKNLDAIVNYCQKDVAAVANIILKLKNKPLLSEADISIAD